MKASLLLCFLCASLLFLQLHLVHASDETGASSNVISLNEANFESTIAHGIWFIKFYAPWCGHCKHLAPTWEALATARNVARSKVKIASVNCDENRSICTKAEVPGFPSLYIYKDGEKYGEFREMRTLDGLNKYLDDLMQDQKSNGKVETLTNTNFDKLTTASLNGVWFIKFYAPWCGHCQQLAPTWNELAAELEGTNVQVAKVDCTAEPNLQARFNIAGYPTLLLIDGNKVYEYENYRTIESMKAFALGDYKRSAQFKAKPSANSVSGGANLLAIILNNPYYMFGSVIALLALALVCLALVVCCINDDDEYVPKKKTRAAKVSLENETAQDAEEQEEPMLSAEKEQKQD